MQPATNPARPTEDLHSILSRFQSWAGKPPENLNGRKQNSEGVREIPMEQAMRQLRSRRSAGAAPAAESPRITQATAVAGVPETNAEVAGKAASVPPAAAPALTKMAIAESAAEVKAAIAKQTGAKSTERAGALTPKGAKAAGLEAAARRNSAGRMQSAKAQPEAASVKERSVAKRAAARKSSAKKARAAASRRKQATKSVKSLQPAARKTAKRPRSGAQKSREAARATGKPEFREVLARSVHTNKAENKQERRQRVSVRLSNAEERRLQHRAAKAGLTVSEYLRQTALGLSQEARLETHGRPAAAAPLFAASASQSSSGLGGWIALLRNRFLASPTRIAERA